MSFHRSFVEIFSVRWKNLKHPFSWVFFQGFQFFGGNYVYQKIENLGVVNTGKNVTFLNLRLFYL